MESLNLELEQISAGECAVVRATGEIDLSTAPRLRDVLSRPGADHVVVDLRGVAFLDSTGLGVLVGALKRLRRRGGSLKVVTHRAGRVVKLFELTNLSHAFDLHTSIVDAIESDTNWQTATGSAPAEWCHKQGLRLIPACAGTYLPNGRRRRLRNDLGYFHPEIRTRRSKII